MNKLYIILACIITLNTYAYTNNKTSQTIRGTVVDKTTGYPLIGATVILVNSEPIKGTTTNANGDFELPEVDFGRQNIKITYLGYKAASINNLLVTSGKEVVVNILLDEEVTSVDEVIVKAKTNKVGTQNEMATISARTFSIEETERFAGSLGDPARMVANYAGVATQNDSRNDIIIRGNSPSGVLWRLEGIEVPNPNHFGALGTTGGPVSMINNNLLTNSDFFTGAFPAEYGNALAGAFDLNLRSGNNKKTEFTGQVGFNGFEGGIEGPLFETSKGQKASYLANFRYSTLDVMHKLGMSSGTGEAIPQYKDFTFMIDVPDTKLGRFKLFGLYGNSYIELGRNFSDSSDNSYNGRGTATNFGSGLFVIGLSHIYFFNENVKIKTTISHQTTKAQTKLDSVINREYEKPYVGQDLEETKSSLSTKLTYKMNKKNNVNIGLIADYFSINYIDSIYDNNYNKFLFGNNAQENLSLLQSYAQWQHKFDNKFTTYAGIHMQYFDFTKETALEPRLGLNWQISNKHSLNAGYGKHSQTQPKAIYFYESYNQAGTESFTTNQNLEFTKSHHYIVGHNFLINNNLRLKTEVYYQDIYNVPVKESFPEFSILNTGADFGGTYEDSLINKGTGSNYGLEITFEKFLSSGYYFLFTTSLYESKFKGYDKVERNTAFNGNYVLNLLAGYEFTLKKNFMLTFDIRTVFAGGKRYTPINLAESDLQNEAVYDWSNAYKNKHDSYFRSDLRIGLKHNGKNFSQEWGLDLQNITNYQSIFMQLYDAEKNEIYKVYQQGFMPMMLYRINF